ARAAAGRCPALALPLLARPARSPDYHRPRGAGPTRGGRRPRPCAPADERAGSYRRQLPAPRGYEIGLAPRDRERRALEPGAPSRNPRRDARAQLRVEGAGRRVVAAGRDRLADGHDRRAADRAAPVLRGAGAYRVRIAVAWIAIAVATQARVAADARIAAIAVARIATVAIARIAPVAVAAVAAGAPITAVAAVAPVAIAWVAIAIAVRVRAGVAVAIWSER